MRGFAPPWFVAGGWAVDLYLGRLTREHADVEVAIFREDQRAAQRHFEGWRLLKVSDGALSEWRAGERLELPVHEVHCLGGPADLPRLELLLNERRGDLWAFRRNEIVTRPLAMCYMTSAAGVRVLAPEIVLLYKSRNAGAKDEQDFDALAPRLDEERRAWLRAAVAACEGGSHPWLGRL